MYILKQLFFSISVNSGYRNIYLDFKEKLLNIQCTSKNKMKIIILSLNKCMRQGAIKSINSLLEEEINSVVMVVMQSEIRCGNLLMTILKLGSF